MNFWLIRYNNFYVEENMCIVHLWGGFDHPFIKLKARVL